ncbi:hypothetical protein QQ045_000079 [Rhodiola kirilowii]
MGIRALISDECVGGGGRTILVGMKMEEERSRGVLTWSLMKAARPGDLVVAVHVLTQNDQSSDAAADYSLLSLVKAFDSVLAVYEGFCNLKQVELKLKICRGSSVKKVLMLEAYSLVADMAVVGTSSNTMWRSSSVAKYLSRKLPKECSLLAVKNGKAVFQKEASPRTFTGTKMSQVANEGIVANHVYKDFRKGCSMSFCLPDASCPRLPNDPFSVDELEASSLAVASADTLEAELKPGWPLLHRSIYFSSIAAHSSFSSFRIFPNEMERLKEKYSSTCKIYTYQELSAATSNFSPENVIGNGGNSLVYIGRLPNENELAVKVLKPGKDAVKEFSSELEILTNLNHKNIMPLRGFCFENTALILVYDFLSKGSVEDRLHGDLNDTVSVMFGWSQRYNVALGVAEAINYLHSGGAEPVIHRDVKSSNILLADDFEPKLSDFGLAERVSTSSSYNTCSDVAGTFGYLAPEYFMYGKVNNKIDVYAFGVVLLELLSGRKPISNEYPKGQGSLVLWATPILRDGKLSQLLDPKLSSDYDHHLIERMSLAATLCVRREPRARPHMNIILKVLQGDQDMKNWAEAEAITYDAAHEGAGPSHDLKSLLNFALLEVEDDSISMSSTHQNISLENYLQGRRSCSCSSN